MIRRATALAAVAVLALALAPPTRAAKPQIAGLQVALRAHGLYLGPIDGIPGPLTRAAVRAFQRKAGIAVDGLAGIETRKRLGPLGRPLFGKRQLKLGDFGWDVSVLQFLLTQRGVYRGALDGYYGRETMRAVRAYQRRWGLAVDGVTGPATLASFRTPRGKLATRERPPAVLASNPQTVRTLIDATARQHRVDPALARALAWMESGYQTNLTSSAGAWGVMQIIPTTWDFVEEVVLGRDVPRTPQGNIRVGVALLHHLLHRFDGDVRAALGAWYQGEAAVRKHGLYPETRQFVANVLALRAKV